MENIIKAELPAGTYYIGDLCYVLDDRWDEVCSQVIEGSSVIDGRFVLDDGSEFVSFSTAYGDGEYYDNKNRSYCVDSGCIGAILVDNISETEMKNLRLGNVCEFTEDFTCQNDNGNMEFGNIYIETNY